MTGYSELLVEYDSLQAVYEEQTTKCDALQEENAALQEEVIKWRTWGDAMPYGPLNDLLALAVKNLLVVTDIAYWINNGPQKIKRENPSEEAKT